MVTIVDEFVLLRSLRRDAPQRVEVEAATLGEALAAAERVYGLSIKPATAEDKYFTVRDPSRPPEVSKPPPVSGLLPSVTTRLRQRRQRDLRGPGQGNADIHVRRGGQELCPRQDLDFVLLPGDLVVVGMLMC